MDPKPLFNFNDQELRLYTKVQMRIGGIPNFCSGAMMSGFSGGQGRALPTVVGDPRPKEFKQCDTFAAYAEYYGTDGCYAVPEEYAYLFFLEALYNKAANGFGGINMWAGGDWATKTWFIADRMTGKMAEDRYPNRLSCASFMTYFSAPGMGYTYGRVVVSPLADGAHGGQCSGGVWAPNLPYLRERLDSALLELNQHALYLAENYEVRAVPDPVGRLY